MKCPNCGNELGEGKLLCENCGEEIKIVPDFDIELEDKLKESISVMIEDIAVENQSENDAASKDSDNERLEYTFEDDIKDELRDYLPKGLSKVHINKKITIAVSIVLLMSCLLVIVILSVNNYRYHSFDYQYEKAVVCAAHNNYPEAIGYLERALAIDSENLDVRFLLAKYYEKNGQQQGAISLLKEILGTDAEFAKRDEVYDMLLGIWEAKEDYAEMGDILKQCDVSRIVSKYNKYAALKPVFNKAGGVYDELISISLKGNAQGFVYYTLDGSVPTDNSSVYETPILLESGEYTIRAMFVNMYGVQSEVETQHYYISLSQPDNPVIDPESGEYKRPVLIEAFHDNDTKVYYTTDGSVPDKNSFRYIDPIEMPFGVSNFSFISIDESGLGSEVVNRSYHLEIQANFNPELALQVLKNSLWAEGKLLNVEGNVPNKLGMNQYKVNTIFQDGETVYYIVYEEYMDTLGKSHNTNNIYAIDVNTADLYKAYKVDEGVYNLQPFSE
ncbi:MAG: chitobiase/beta-hexosaminidase C-terminal domain-containing protein [Lachnospiraceae bacterium]|nr:chitobiase/beta-hexosaminidase C-terminal domain-containing protein [Lachnospiraceae bacterium]